MAPSTEPMTHVDHRKLRHFLIVSFEKFGVPKSDAEIAAHTEELESVRHRLTELIGGLTD